MILLFGTVLTFSRFLGRNAYFHVLITHSYCTGEFSKPPLRLLSEQKFYNVLQKSIPKPLSFWQPGRDDPRVAYATFVVVCAFCCMSGLFIKFNYILWMTCAYACMYVCMHVSNIRLRSKFEWSHVWPPAHLFSFCRIDLFSDLIFDVCR